MAEGLVSDTNLTAIANAIRSKNGSSDRYTPATMATAIENIPSSDTLVEMLESKTNLQYALAYTPITTCPMFTVNSSVQYMGGMFANCRQLATIPLLDTSGVISMCGYYTQATGSSNANGGLFVGCTSLTTIPLLDTSNNTTFNYMFSSCTRLTTVPQLSFVAATGTSALKNSFSGCPALSNTSLNNILASLLTKGGTAKANNTLKYIGLSSTQATTCTGLSNWAALSAAGWTTGY